MEEGRILAIDPGTKRIGLAISDPLGISAQGLDSLGYEGYEKLAQDLKSLIAEYSVRKIIIGLPLNLNGTSGPKAKEAVELADKLKDDFGIPIQTWDERLTSAQAERIMIQADTRRQKRKELRDKLSAQIILQSYLAVNSGV